METKPEEFSSTSCGPPRKTRRRKSGTSSCKRWRESSWFKACVYINVEPAFRTVTAVFCKNTINVKMIRSQGPTLALWFLFPNSQNGLGKVHTKSHRHSGQELCLWFSVVLVSHRKVTLKMCWCLVGGWYFSNYYMHINKYRFCKIRYYMNCVPLLWIKLFVCAKQNTCN